MTNNNTTKENTMSYIEKAVKNINELVNSGMSLKEAIVETSWEFGILQGELWNEF